MSLMGRFFRYRCNFCFVDEEVDLYGLPQNWRYLPASMTQKSIRHICASCIELKAHGHEKLKDSGTI